MVNTIIKTFGILTLLSDIFIMLLLTSIIIRFFKRITLVEKLLSILGKRAISLAFIVALTATSGSLFFSEVAHLTPCKLCWFQRIFMYPQVVILGIAIYLKDQKIWKHIIPMSLIGGSISMYNYYLQLFPSSATLCPVDSLESCSRVIVMQFGYVTFAVMALSASLLILILMLIARKSNI